MRALTMPLAELADYEEIIKTRTKEYGMVQIAGCVSSQKTHLMYALGGGVRYRLGVFSSDEKAKQAYDEYRFLDDNVYYYPAKDLLFYHADIKGKYLLGQRMEAVRALIEAEKEEELTVITTADALLDGLLPLEEFSGSQISLKSGDAVDLTELQYLLEEMGYV
ncbi:MAG: transcription-repair coupling factor (superfamily II helicase), partial [Lachnospiraceae bacterium]|nr:transcription-repair coupling factor (superfamily II helicase) [Lachnospiraceae bacterium]